MSAIKDIAEGWPNRAELIATSSVCRAIFETWPRAQIIGFVAAEETPAEASEAAISIPQAPEHTPIPRPAEPSKPTLIPACLSAFSDLPCWVGWKFFQKPGRREPDKVPVDPHVGNLAKVNDSRTWGTLEAALRLMKVQALPGVGIMSAGAPEIAFVDLDDVLDPATGEVINNSAAKLLDECSHTYAEITPSGGGLRIIGTAPEIQASLGHKGTILNGLKIEIYKATGRFLTVTGKRSGDHPDALGDIGATLLDLLPLFGVSRDRPGEGGQDAREDSELVRRIVTGQGYHNELCALAARYIGRGMAADAAAETLRGLMLSHPEGPRDERWTDRYYSIDELVGSATKKYAGNEEGRRAIARTTHRLLKARRPLSEIKVAVLAEAERHNIAPATARRIATSIIRSGAHAI